MSSVKSIKCTSCAAPLNLFGGGRVESITCSYCKSVLDLNDDCKVLTNFKNIRERHALPFDIGMKGKVKGIEYTIIGRVTYAATAYPHGEWTDFLLFSALYGYAYLTYEEGHLIYSKRNRTFPNLTWLESMHSSPIYVEHKAYVPFDEYEAKVTYVEGELTWITKRNDKTLFIDLIAPPHGISVEKTKGEIEYYEAEYLESDEVYEAFGVNKKEKAKSLHALKALQRPFLKSLSYIAYWVLFIVALLFLAVSFDGSGKLIKSIAADNQQVKLVNFSVNSNKYLLDLELQSPTAKELNNFNLQIHKNSKLIFSLTPNSAYIFNEENNILQKKLQAWDKGAKKVLISLNLEKLGSYQLSIKPIDMSIPSTLFVKVYQERSQTTYVTWFFVLTLILWLIYKFIHWSYKFKLEGERGIYLEHDAAENNSFSLKITITLLVISIFIMLQFNN